MNNIELYIIKLFFSYSCFQKYRNSFDTSFLKQNHKELYRIYVCLSLFHEKFPEKNVHSAEELELFYESQFPTVNHRGKDELQAICKRIASIEVDEAIAEEYFRECNKRVKAAKMAFLALEVADGKKTYQELITEARALPEDEVGGDYSEFVSDDLESIQAKINEPGLSWRLDCLNEMLGPLRKGDFGFIFARPESGKTTLLADSVSHMAESASGPILWFNNEEQGEKVLIRCIQACLGITTQELFVDYKKHRDKYREITKEKLHIFDAASIHTRDVERLCSRYNPSLIIFDQIDKLKGFKEKDERKDLELKELYQWARELAKKFGPVIGVCQAGAT